MTPMLHVLQSGMVYCSVPPAVQLALATPAPPAQPFPQTRPGPALTMRAAASALPHAPLASPPWLAPAGHPPARLAPGAPLV
jgi:hypothetical protein